MLSVGHQLMQARHARGLSIEDVAFETRIPHPRLRDLENDDLSNFANLTYAKGFLKLYSRFLNLDLSDYLDEFDTSLIADVTGHEYAHAPNSVRLLSAPAFATEDGQRSRLAGNAFSAAALALVLIGGGWLYFKSRRSEPALAVSIPGQTAAPVSQTPAAARPINTLAKIDTRDLGIALPPQPNPPPPKAIPLPSDSVRKATPVDDFGNEIQ